MCLLEELVLEVRIAGQTRFKFFGLSSLLFCHLGPLCTCLAHHELLDVLPGEMLRFANWTWIDLKQSVVVIMVVVIGIVVLRRLVLHRWLC